MLFSLLNYFIVIRFLMVASGKQWFRELLGGSTLKMLVVYTLKMRDC